MEKARDDDARVRAKARAEARVKARRMWRDAEKATSDHVYCQRKNVKPRGLRAFRFKNGSRPLLVPMWGEDRKLQNLQFIHADGRKHGLKGGRQSDCHRWVKKPSDGDGNTICICEGWATGESIYQATKHAVIVAFNADNLPSVAKWVHRRHPQHKIVIFADDDWKTAGNPGGTKAKEAARAVKGLVAVPVFGSDRGDKDTDFNDMMNAAGTEAVRQTIDDGATEPDDRNNNMERPVEAG